MKELEEKLRTEEMHVGVLEVENEALRKENEILKARLRECKCDSGQGVDLTPYPPVIRKHRKVSDVGQVHTLENDSDLDGNLGDIGEDAGARHLTAESPGYQNILSPMDALLAAVASEASQ